MTDLETKLAEARERLIKRGVHYRLWRFEGWRFEGFHACAAIAREVVAEKDAEIARLKDELSRWKHVC